VLQHSKVTAWSNRAGGIVRNSLAGIFIAGIITQAGYSFAVDGSAAKARQALADLKEITISSSYLSELKSIEATMNIADTYQREHEDENAGIFYNLVIQKARILQDKVTVASPAPATVNASPTPNHATVASSQAIRGVTGAMSSYTVEKGDSLRLIASRLGVSRQHLITINHLGSKPLLKIGQKLKYDNRRIIPKMIENGLVINIPDRTLYYFKQGELTLSLPVALGSPSKDDDFNWQTPTGRFRIIEKIRNPTWTVPPSIQAEMEAQGKEVVTTVPPGPDSPLGKFAIRTSLPGIMIHSTSKPWSINSYTSHGCIRLFPDNMEAFFKQIPVNTPGEIIYKPVKVTVGETGRVFLEVHRDVYDRKIDLATEARTLIAKKRLSDRVDWQKIRNMVKQPNGTVQDITLDRKGIGASHVTDKGSPSASGQS